MQDMPAAIVDEAYQAAQAQMPAVSDQAEYALPDGFCYLDEAVEGVLWDAKYATEDNFTGSVVNGYASNRIALSEQAAKQLTVARDLAAEKDLVLLIWDGARPQRAVDRFVEWAKEPEDGKTKDEHYPNLKKTRLFDEGYIARRSGHSRGCAIDLTLADRDGIPLDMGGCFDLLDKRSHHGAKGITEEQTANRNLLKAIMEKAGFKPYTNEWWHYSLNREPFPDTYFDFEIGGTPLSELSQTEASVSTDKVP